MEGINSWADRQHHRFFAGISVAAVEEDFPATSSHILVTASLSNGTTRSQPLPSHVNLIILVCGDQILFLRSTGAKANHHPQGDSVYLVTISLKLHRLTHRRVGTQPDAASGRLQFNVCSSASAFCSQIGICISAKLASALARLVRA